MLKIRQAISSDASTIARFNQSLAHESEELVLQDDIIQRGVIRGLGRPDLCRYYLAEIDGVVVGQTMVTFELTDWRDGVIWWIQSVYVERAFRGRGVFTALLQHIHASGKQEQDFRGFRLYVDRSNHSAKTVYAKLGFISTNYDLLEKLES